MCNEPLPLIYKRRSLFFFLFFLQPPSLTRRNRFIHRSSLPQAHLPRCPTPKPPQSLKMACLRLRKALSSKKPPASRYRSCLQSSTITHQINPQVFIGNLAYSTTDEGLKTFFASVQSDMSVLSPFVAPFPLLTPTFSISVQVIKRGPKSAGYGFVAVSSAEAAQMAIETLAGEELDGRKVIVEIAKPADQKDKEKKDKRTRRRPGRRGSKPVPGEVTEAEANGDIVKVDDADAVPPTEVAKPKKKKKTNVCPFPPSSLGSSLIPFAAA